MYRRFAPTCSEVPSRALRMLCAGWACLVVRASQHHFPRKWGAGGENVLGFVQCPWERVGPVMYRRFAPTCGEVPSRALRMLCAGWACLVIRASQHHFLRKWGGGGENVLGFVQCPWARVGPRVGVAGQTGAHLVDVHRVLLGARFGRRGRGGRCSRSNRLRLGRRLGLCGGPRRPHCPLANGVHLGLP